MKASVCVMDSETGRDLEFALCRKVQSCEELVQAVGRNGRPDLSRYLRVVRRWHLLRGHLERVLMSYPEPVLNTLLGSFPILLSGTAAEERSAA